MAEGVDHGFLGAVFGVGLVFENSEDGNVNELFVGANEVVEELRFTRKDAGDERGLIRHGWFHAACVPLPELSFGVWAKAKQLYGISGERKSNKLFAAWFGQDPPQNRG